MALSIPRPTRKDIRDRTAHLPAGLDRPGHADRARVGAGHRQHHLHLDPGRQAAAREARAGAAHRAVHGDVHALYADGADLRDPYLSPLFGDFTPGYPPTQIQTGTRDLFLSNSVRMHRALRAAVLAPRRVPPIIPDRITTLPMALPPLRVPTTPSPQEKATVAQDGTFTFHVLNVYANAPVDVDIVSAPPIGSAAFLRGFADYQRNNPGSFETMDWPILMEVVPVSASGEAILHPPAHLPLFEDLRGADQRVPGTGGHYGALGRNSGAAFVARQAVLPARSDR